MKQVRYAIIRAGLEGIAFLGPVARLLKAGGRGVIFTLHHVRPKQDQPFDPNAILSITPEFLEQAIQASLDCGLTPVAAEDLPQLLDDPSDRRAFVSFTLDDGYRNNAEYAAPIFARYGVPYTIFITSGFVERTRSLWWETAEMLARQAEEISFDFGHGVEIVALNTTALKQQAFDRIAAFVASHDEDEAVARLDEAARKHNIDPLRITADLTMDVHELRQLAQDPLARFGAHTLTHPNMRRVSDQRLEQEIVESASDLERYTSKRPRIFAYPYGFKAAVGPREIAAVAAAGLPMAVTTQPGVLQASDLANVTAFNRVSLNGYYQKKRYVKALISGLPFKFL